MDKEIEKKKEIKLSKQEKQDEKFRRAIMAGAKLGETSLSKIAWGVAHKKIEVTSGKLDYRVHQVINCASHLIAQNQWFTLVMGSGVEEKKGSIGIGKRERPFVAIPYKTFKDFVDDQSLKTKEVVEIFKKVPEVILEGKTKIPCCSEDENWMDITLYKDNICGLAIAYGNEEFGRYRSDRKLRGRGHKKEEPVLILIFSNAYGLALFSHAMNRKGTQLLKSGFYHLKKEAQELFHAVRWQNGLIILNVEQASIAMNLSWPLKHKSDLYRRVKFIKEIFRVLKDNKFINYSDDLKKFEQGQTIEKKTWKFYVRKGN